MSSHSMSKYQRTMVRLGIVVMIVASAAGTAALAQAATHGRPVTRSAYIGETEKNIPAGGRS